MSSKTWVYIIILVLVLAAAGVFFWWMYKGGQITPKAEETPTPTVTQAFTDVDPTYWAYKEIEGVNEKGYMIGYTEFKPDLDATRADAVATIAKAYGKSYDSPTPSFTDVPTTHWAYEYIEGLKQAGWINGFEADGDTTIFKPSDPIDRASLSVIIARAFAGSDDLVVSPADPELFTDLPTTHSAYRHIQ